MFYLCILRYVWLVSYINIDTEQGDDAIVVQIDKRRPLAKQEVEVEKQDKDFSDLIGQLDIYCGSMGPVDRQGR